MAKRRELQPSELVRPASADSRKEELSEAPPEKGKLDDLFGYIAGRYANGGVNKDLIWVNLARKILGPSPVSTKVALAKINPDYSSLLIDGDSFVFDFEHRRTKDKTTKYRATLTFTSYKSGDIQKLHPLWHLASIVPGGLSRL